MQTILHPARTSSSTLLRCLKSVKLQTNPVYVEKSGFGDLPPKPKRRSSSHREKLQAEEPNYSEASSLEEASSINEPASDLFFRCLLAIPKCPQQEPSPLLPRSRSTSSRLFANHFAEPLLT